MIDINQGTLFNLYMFYLRLLITPEGLGWLNELGSWIT
jgi:hypothetical protein